MAVLAGVEEIAYRAGSGVVVSAVHGRHRTRPDERWLENLAARRSDGVLLILSELSKGQQTRLDALGVPVVIVDPAGTPAPGIPSVGATNWAGGLAAAGSIWSSWVTNGSRSSAARPTYCAAGPGWTATGRRWVRPG